MTTNITWGQLEQALIYEGMTSGEREAFRSILDRVITLGSGKELRKAKHLTRDDIGKTLCATNIQGSAFPGGVIHDVLLGEGSKLNHLWVVIDSKLVPLEWEKEITLVVSNG